MVITLTPEIEKALTVEAHRRGTTPEVVALANLKKSLLAPDAQAREDQDVTQIEAEIDHLYDEIQYLLQQSVKNPQLRGEIESKRERLLSLQILGASAMRRRAEAKRNLKPGEGYRILEQATKWLEK